MTPQQFLFLGGMIITILLCIGVLWTFGKTKPESTENYYRLLATSTILVAVIMITSFVFSMMPTHNTYPFKLSTIIFISVLSLLFGWIIAFPFRYFYKIDLSKYAPSTIMNETKTCQTHSNEKVAYVILWVIFALLICVTFFVSISSNSNTESSLTKQQLLMIISLPFFIGLLVPLTQIWSIIKDKFKPMGYISIVIAILTAVIALILDSKYPEGFFFEVSPNRAACLKRQVSRDHFGENRSCGCCGKGTVGGIPPNYAEWLNIDPNTGDLWHRPDGQRIINLESDTFSNAQEAVCTSCGPPAYITYL
jgi:cytochrome bd-type quinol oxidase subunit 2